MFVIGPDNKVRRVEYVKDHGAPQLRGDPGGGETGIELKLGAERAGIAVISAIAGAAKDLAADDREGGTGARSR